MSENHDLWSDAIARKPVNVPITIIKSAARPLVDRTGGLVEAEVKTGADGSFLIHRIYLSAPTIGWNMRFTAFRHRAIPIYPVWAEYEVDPGEASCEGKPSNMFPWLQETIGRATVDDPPGAAPGIGRGS